MKCIEFGRLIDYADGRITSEPEAAQIGSHLAQCSQCSATVQWYQEFRGLGRTLSLAEPPAWVVKRAERLAVAGARSSPRQIGRVASAFAKLIFDSFGEPAPQGARSAQPAQRQLAYWVDNYSVELQITKSDGNGTTLQGQVVEASKADFDNVSNVPVELLGSGGPISMTQTNDIGEFTMAGGYAGDYTLSIQTRNLTINIVLQAV